MSMQDSLTIGIYAFSAAMIVVGLGVLRFVLLQSPFLSDMTAFQNAASAVKYFDYVPMAALIGSWVSSMYYASRVRAHPMYAAVSFLFLMISTSVGYFLTLLPEEMASATVFGEVFATFGLTSILMQNLHIIIFVSGLTGMIALYAIRSTPGGGTRAPIR